MESYTIDQKEEKMKIRTIQILIQICFWLLLGAIILNYQLRLVPFLNAFFYTLYALFVSAIPFYLNYFYISKFIFEKKNYLVFSLLIVLMLFISVIIINFTSYGWLIVDENTYDANIDGLSNVLLIVLFSTAVKGMETWFYNRQREAQVEKEKLKAELNFLKIQINPHFLFNTLNNIYSLAYSGDQKAAGMIATLSKILRYMLYDCKEDKVALLNEIELLENYIELQTLKYENARNIDLYTEGILLDHKIAPLLLITFLENSFKHSDIQSNEKGWIKIHALVENNSLDFTVSNSVSDSPIKKQDSSGLGLMNIREQLQLIYPTNHKLAIEKQSGEFHLKLSVYLD